MIRDGAELDEQLSNPTDGVIDTFRRLDGDLIFLGIGGKMGPTLARMTRRASDLAGGPQRRIYGAARFSSPGLPEELRAHGIEPLRCDLLDAEQVGQLPDVPNVVFMAGMKFGTTGQASLTWAMNCLAPAIVCQRYRSSRIVAFSTGNVYGLSPIAAGGSRENDVLSPVGEYAMTAVGRERMFEHFSQQLGIPTVLVRLNYACELRYGVLVDVAQKVLAGEPIDLNMPALNAIWQADANAMALRLFDHVASPPAVFNIAGSETLRVRQIAEAFGKRFGKPTTFVGTESADALLSNSERATALFGRPRVSPDQMIGWIADWLLRGGTTLGKPTHFESREGRF